MEAEKIQLQQRTERLKLPLLKWTKKNDISTNEIKFIEYDHKGGMIHYKQGARSNTEFISYPPSDSQIQETLQSIKKDCQKVLKTSRKDDLSKVAAKFYTLHNSIYYTYNKKLFFSHMVDIKEWFWTAQVNGLTDELAAKIIGQITTDLMLFGSCNLFND